MIRHWVVGAVALLFLATGCGTSPEKPARTELAAAPEPTEEVRDLVLPLDAYQLSVNEIYLIESAKDVLTRACMKKRGHDWDVIDERGRFPDLRNRRRYGVIEMPVATEMGYHTNARLLGSTEVTARKMDRENALDADERNDALDPENGCYRLAGDELARGTHVDDDLVDKLSSGSLKSALRNPDVSAAVRSWSRCMAEQGHEYKDFYTVGEDPRWANSEKPSRAERKTAEADVRCKDRVGLVKLLRETEVAVQERDIRRHKEYFAEVASAKQRHLDAARAVLDRS
ncbi:hypothetical protein [Streptomyces muensis]|uniref:Lipoprotein n=1 Tax=Streptomyces muensis TaxID=1077944 RepID=A0A9X1TLC1_STRM4|nr:hypothetical protein [Streptomyces muensis]MCF1595467.1 hypothetical protein [Streptomyces muensis]